MEKFGVMPPWFLTQATAELPPKVSADVQEAVAVDFVAEPLLAACWTQAVFGGAAGFVLVTRDRIISKTAMSLRQVRFRDITAVQRSPVTKDVVAVAPGQKLDLFNALQMPPAALCDKLFRIIETHWRSQN